MSERRKGMLCALTRWMISRAEDTGRTLPRFAVRHTERCVSCREFAEFARSLSSRLSGELPPLLAKAPDTPWELGYFKTHREIKAAERRLVLRAWPAAATALVLVAGAILLVQVVKRPSGLSPAERAEAVSTIKSLTAAPAGFREVITGAESSLSKEREVLERSLASAVEYLQTRLNIKIERREIPKSL